MTHTLTLQPGQMSLADLRTVWQQAVHIQLSEDAQAGIHASAAAIRQIVDKGDAAYGINTGFGKLASVRIAPADVATLQRNLILSHCCGVGAPLSAPITRLVMVLKLLSLGRGASGGGFCGPVFQRFMTKAVAKYGGGAFNVPESCQFIKIDRNTGARLSDSASGDNVVS